MKVVELLNEENRKDRAEVKKLIRDFQKRYNDISLKLQESVDSVTLLNPYSDIDNIVFISISFEVKDKIHGGIIGYKHYIFPIEEKIRNSPLLNNYDFITDNPYAKIKEYITNNLSIEIEKHEKEVKGKLPYGTYTKEKLMEIIKEKTEEIKKKYEGSGIEIRERFRKTYIDFSVWDTERDICVFTTAYWKTTKESLIGIIETQFKQLEKVITLYLNGEVEKINCVFNRVELRANLDELID